MLSRPLFTLALPEAVVQALRRGGYRFYEDLLHLDKRGLKDKVIELLGKFNYKPSDLLRLAASPLIDTAGQLLQNEASIFHIPTFSQSFDRILGGGVPSGSVLQIYGGPGSGKTQFLLQMCVNVQLPECFGGLEGASIFIDADLGFSPLRLEEIAEGAVRHCMRIASVHHMEDEVKTFSVESILSHVHYMEVRNHVELIATVEQLPAVVTKNPKVKFVVIDSLILPLLAMKSSLERTRIVYLIVNKLSQIAENFNIAVVFSNHITTKIINNTKLLAQALGETLTHRVPQSLLLAKVSDSFTAVLSKSSTTPEVVTQFSVGKTIRTVKELFKLLAEEINDLFHCNFSWEQVNNKWKTLERAYKKKKDNDNMTGRDARPFEFEGEMDEVFEKSRRINSECLVTESEVFVRPEVPRPDSEIDLEAEEGHSPKSETPAKGRIKRGGPTRTEVLEKIRQDRLRYYETKSQQEYEKNRERKRRNDLMEERNTMMREYLASVRQLPPRE